MAEETVEAVRRILIEHIRQPLLYHAKETLWFVWLFQSSVWIAA